MAYSLNNAVVLVCQIFFKKLQNVQPCGDCKEFACLVFQLMGEKMDTSTAVCGPGAYH